MTGQLKCVLLIDDDEDDNYFHRLALEEARVSETVKIVQSSGEALEMLAKENFRPEMIFLDINMPKINGWEFLEELRGIKKDFHPVLVLLTTSMNPADKKRAKDLHGIDFFATKPLTVEKIRAIFEEVGQGRFRNDR